VEAPRRPHAFDRFANACSNAAGRPWAFAAAVTVLVVWAVSGPIFGFSDTWQLIINTGTTIVTFLMVFLIQHTQNKDSKAVQLKLDSLIAAASRASNRLLNLEDLSDAELDHLHRRYAQLAGESPRLHDDSKAPEPE
jgi:low affinity Fe/Cu permease